MFSNILDEIRLLFRKDKESYLCFYKILGFYPRNIEIYQQALLHKSSSVKAKGRLLNNERLEFLGDAILDAVVADIVYKRFEGKREGFLTNTRSKIVQRETFEPDCRKNRTGQADKNTPHGSRHTTAICVEMPLKRLWEPFIWTVGTPPASSSWKNVLSSPT